MTHHLEPWDRALLDALSSDQGLLTLDELAATTGISSSILDALAREGLLIPSTADPDRYHLGDADAIVAGMEILGAGLPLAELLMLARKMDEAMRPIAAEAVQVFERFVRDAVEATTEDPDEAARRLTAAFRRMLPATGRLVDHHFRRLIMVHAQRRIVGS